ncbi:hypothetical protein BDZ90DRAFT_280174 [Jaminaea rosea]|uniref:Cupin type-2 domain-containing protein n=1 Tax=Jaminaea rosea TaxID=1569628 RepID=A0A316UU97_9BASI|nr:hypothetical protein BDZ90DRAFT_280174 [Jaminaea rosea]PWN26675.1 hypothetical protein BDZ90DRAFT_280174 [Jaminaea rosea]
MSSSTASASSAGPVHICRAADVGQGSTGQTNGMTRKSAIVGKSNNVCGTLMLSEPHSGSDIHHHGHSDTIVYSVRGHGSIIYGPNEAEQRHDLKPGDWALIPAWAEHKEVNDGDEEVEWVIVRAGAGEPIVVNLPGGWGSSKSQESS